MSYTAAARASRSRDRIDRLAGRTVPCSSPSNAVRSARRLKAPLTGLFRPDQTWHRPFDGRRWRQAGSGYARTPPSRCNLRDDSSEGSRTPGEGGSGRRSCGHGHRRSRCGSRFYRRRRRQRRRGSSAPKLRCDSGPASSQTRSTSCRPTGAGNGLRRPSATNEPDERFQAGGSG